MSDQHDTHPNLIHDSGTSAFDWQGHRGCRGLMPENSIPAFVEALRYPVTTLELDVVVSSDEQLIVSHEPWMRSDLCLDPDGNPIFEAEAMQHNLYRMTVEEIQAYDCGSLRLPSFPQQQLQPTFKPTLAQVVEAVENFCHQYQRSLPAFNIELKSHPQGYDLFIPKPATFVGLVLRKIRALGIHPQTTLQSFDLQVLEEIRRQDDAVRVSCLIENTTTLAEDLRRLSFTPRVCSPDYQYVTKSVVDDMHTRGIEVIPWTVNDTATMRALIGLGVDGIITDYPDLIGHP